MYRTFLGFAEPLSSTSACHRRDFPARAAPAPWEALNLVWGPAGLGDRVAAGAGAPRLQAAESLGSSSSAPCKGRSEPDENTRFLLLSAPRG